jgi:hypothetical protein
MRRAMICVSVMLALFLVWPMIFGQHGEGAAAAATATREAPKPIPAVAVAAVIPIPAKVSLPAAIAPKSCYKRYQAAFQKCARGDQACSINAADQWDLCEATGFWPE